MKIHDNSQINFTSNLVAKVHFSKKNKHYFLRAWDFFRIDRKVQLFLQQETQIAHQLINRAWQIVPPSWLQLKHSQNAQLIKLFFNPNKFLFPRKTTTRINKTNFQFSPAPKRPKIRSIFLWGPTNSPEIINLLALIFSHQKTFPKKRITIYCPLSINPRGYRLTKKNATTTGGHKNFLLPKVRTRGTNNNALWWKSKQNPRGSPCLSAAPVCRNLLLAPLP